MCEAVTWRLRFATAARHNKRVKRERENSFRLPHHATATEQSQSRYLTRLRRRKRVLIKLAQKRVDIATKWNQFASAILRPSMARFSSRFASKYGRWLWSCAVIKGAASSEINNFFDETSRATKRDDDKNQNFLWKWSKLKEDVDEEESTWTTILVC